MRPTLAQKMSNARRGEAMVRQESSQSTLAAAKSRAAAVLVRGPAY